MLLKDKYCFYSLREIQLHIEKALVEHSYLLEATCAYGIVEGFNLVWFSEDKAWVVNLGTTTKLC